MGACTKTNLKDTILVIFNFCRFGNLQSYLINNRDKFIDQLNGVVNIPPDSNKMDTTPANQPVSNDLTEGRMNEAVNLKEEDSKSQQPAQEVNSTTKTEDSEGTLNKMLKTSDLISWSLQISRGM
ncbi:vascular endothelial growth factor receptor 1-like [Daphnia pulicaria]|uniref:vascular endothelial growth factor receptor 1-like n=1 Tax=Daphnia pulicaria TaxID=35523 RepID=UPI001EECC8D6|nr:vascular endothelial growth factor receptor 1-like [Daphnia pulicaria]